MRAMQALVLLLAGVLIPPFVAVGQPGPVSGVYQVTSGTNLVIGGFAGVLAYRLPNSTQAYVDLMVDTQRNLAQLMFLGPDKRTVLQTDPPPGGTGVPFVFRGTIFPDHIELGEVLLPTPGTLEASAKYTVRFASDELTINGTLMVPVDGADIPNTFVHTNVAAKLASTLIIQAPGSGTVRLEWNSASNSLYQLQFRPFADQGGWMNLGSVLTGVSARTFILESVPPEAGQRFYRVQTLP